MHNLCELFLPFRSAKVAGISFGAAAGTFGGASGMVIGGMVGNSIGGALGNGAGTVINDGPSTVSHVAGGVSRGVAKAGGYVKGAYDAGGATGVLSATIGQPVEKRVNRILDSVDGTLRSVEDANREGYD